MRARSAVWLVAVGLWLGGVPVAAQTRASDEGRVAQATKKGKKKSKAKGKAPATTTGAPAAAPATAPAAPTAVQPTTDSAGVLDLSDVKDDEAAKKELIQQGGTKKSEGAFDFGSSAGEQAGLASINAPRGSMVAFSTAPNKTAQDGTGRNGLYTKHLLKELQVPNRKIEDVFKRVRENVMKESANEQTPWENSAMTGDFYFSASR